MSSGSMHEWIDALVAALRGDAALMAVATGVYQEAAPPEATYPFVLVRFVTGSDPRLLRGGWAVRTFDLVAVSQSTASTEAETLLGLLEAALERAPLAIARHTQVSLRREVPIWRRGVADDGLTYWQAGGTYSLRYI